VYYRKEDGLFRKNRKISKGTGDFLYRDAWRDTRDAWFSFDAWRVANHVACRAISPSVGDGTP
jgi:hypothetical protein